MHCASVFQRESDLLSDDRVTHFEQVLQHPFAAESKLLAEPGIVGHPSEIVLKDISSSRVTSGRIAHRRMKGSTSRFGIVCCAMEDV